jgi:hypothetical protein
VTTTGLLHSVRGKRLLLSHFYILKATTLPRQARDKHRESTQKGVVSAGRCKDGTTIDLFNSVFLLDGGGGAATTAGEVGAAAAEVRTPAPADLKSALRMGRPSSLNLSGLT